MTHQLRGLFKRITGDTVSYDALTKQPITDAETKLKLFNEATSASISGLELYLKSMTKLIDHQLGEKFNECKELFSKYDKPNDQVMGTVFGRMNEIQKEISTDVNELMRNIEVFVLKPLIDYQKELSIVKDNKKELKDAYDKIEQSRQNVDKSRRDLESSQKTVNQSHRMTMLREFESKRFTELTKLEEKLNKSEKELDEATSVANEKYDKYTESLYKRIAEECELTNCYLNYLKMQKKYHKSALKKLDTLIPGVEDSINNYHKKPVFGYPLEEYVQRSLRATSNGQPQQLVSPVIKKLIDGMCRQNAFCEEGIFRIAGSRVKMNCLLYAINSGYLEYLDTTNDFDVHCLAGVLKQYIRELPDSILCNHLYDEWIKAIKSTSNKLEAFEYVLDKLPKVNYDNLRYLIKFLAKIVENSEQTKMTNSNMGICFGVSLLSNNNPLNNSNNSSSSNSLNTSQSDYNSSKSIDMATATNVFDFLLTNHEQLFPGEINFLTVTLSSKPSITQRSVTNGYATLPKNNHINDTNQPPAVVHRRNPNSFITNQEIVLNTLDQQSTLDSNSNQTSPPSIKISLNTFNPSSSSPSSNSMASLASNTNNVSITNINRHIKKSSYDSRQIEDDKYSSNNSINSISNKSVNNQDSSASTSPKQRNKKQAPAPPPSKLNDSTNIEPISNLPSAPSTLNEDHTTNSIYPKLMPNFNTISTSVSNTIKGANEISSMPTSTSTTTKIIEKPNQPPPSIPNRPPPIGFNLNVSDSTPLSNELPYPVATASNTFTNSVLMCSSLSTNSSSSTSSTSSSSSQEMLNTTTCLVNKAPKPAVPRRPGGITAQINKFNRGGDIDIDDNSNNKNQPTAAIKASSEITSL